MKLAFSLLTHLVVLAPSQVSPDSILSHLLVGKQPKKQPSSRQQPKCTLKNQHSGLVGPLLKTLSWASHSLRKNCSPYNGLQALHDSASVPVWCHLSPPSFCLMHCSPCGPPHGPSRPPGTLPPHRDTRVIPSARLFSHKSCSLTSFRPSLTCHSLSQNFPDTLF